jgi:methylated-DNA-[protein]-cysteine S-methyltransferase
VKRPERLRPPPTNKPAVATEPAWSTQAWQTRRSRPHIARPRSVFLVMPDRRRAVEEGSQVMMSATSNTARVHTTVPSPLGELTLVREDERMVGMYFAHHWYRPPQNSFGPRVDHGFDAVVAQLAEYFAGSRQVFDLPMALTGTPEQVAAWRLVSRIPYGRTTTYGALGRELGLQVSAKDVGKLIGRNPLSILIPCHRVIGVSGNLTGYAGGLARKRALLELERALPVRPEQLMLSFGDAIADTGGDFRLRVTGLIAPIR